ncbi:MAG TPA: aminotransferase class V-fold PLP-dependent enzyme [Pyrinomonadaceae bacterium]|nr:aminotransferase class V-fold PLP-dependent enzyme [Pyrinomonadaceae bacterium]
MTPELRALFPITARAVYLNHAAVSPPPTTTIEAVESQLKDVHENGSRNFRSWLATRERARESLARLLGARPEQVAFMRNTSDGLSTVANGLDWKAGDNIVTFRREFPSNIYPWLRVRDAFGVEVRMGEERDGRVDLDELESLIDQNTRVVAISHVQFASGFRADLERLGRAARQRGALLVVDTIQSLGVVPLDVEAELVDVAAGAGHKWLLTPEGVGYLYLSDRARERIQPTLVGWTSVPDPDDFLNFEQGWSRGALAWETGTAPAALLYGLQASLDLLNQYGAQAIAGYLDDLTNHLCDLVHTKHYDIISSRSPGEKSQIVCIRHRDGLSAMALYAHLKARNIITAPRNDRLRIAPHLYNTREEMDQLVDALP